MLNVEYRQSPNDKANWELDFNAVWTLTSSDCSPLNWTQIYSVPGPSSLKIIDSILIEFEEGLM